MGTATKNEASDFEVYIDVSKTARMHLIKVDIYLLACLPKNFTVVSAGNTPSLVKSCWYARMGMEFLQVPEH